MNKDGRRDKTGPKHQHIWAWEAQSNHLAEAGPGEAAPRRGRAWGARAPPLAPPGPGQVGSEVSFCADGGFAGVFILGAPEPPPRTYIMMGTPPSTS